MFLVTALRRRCLLNKISHAFSTSTIRRHCSCFKCVGAGAGVLATAFHMQVMLLSDCHLTYIKCMYISTEISSTYATTNRSSLFCRSIFRYKHIFFCYNSLVTQKNTFLDKFEQQFCT
jgi:hypothetical protein